MAKLSARDRKALPSSAFAVPGRRGWPMPDKSHARFALTQVGRSLRKGNITPGEAARIRSKAHGILYPGSNYEKHNLSRKK